MNQKSKVFFMLTLEMPVMNQKSKGFLCLIWRVKSCFL